MKLTRTERLLLPRLKRAYPHIYGTQGLEYAASHTARCEGMRVEGWGKGYRHPDGSIRAIPPRVKR